jgi:hypothetical protein
VIADVLLERLNPGTVLEQYQAQLLGALRAVDRDEDGLDQADIDLVQAKEAARARASAISQILGYDLDGDLTVTRSELAGGVSGEPVVRDRQVTNLLAQYDGNADGTITVAEAAASARKNDRDALRGTLLALDPDRDGRLTVVELRGLADQAFRQVDGDGDSKISAEEHKAIAPRLARIRLRRSAPQCELPALPAGAKLVVYGAYSSHALSSVAIGGQAQQTNFLDVKIEPGADPLYLVLTSYESMLWRLTGATERLAQVVVSSSQADRSDAGSGPAAWPRRDPSAPKPVSASGVIGVARDKVAFAHIDCPPFFSDPTGNATDRALASIERSLGRAPDTAVGAYAVRHVSLPSGQTVRADAAATPLPEGFDAQVWQEATRFWPGGLVSVDARDVVAPLKVEPYAVLPSQMGLAQLVGTGALERESDEVFRVVRPIAHLPARMTGAHGTHLVLAKGVPLPPGDPGHSCITREDTAAPIAHRARCTPPPVVVMPPTR